MNEDYSSEFGGALSALKNGRKVSRKGWYLGGMYLLLQVPDENSKMSLPYIYLTIPGSKGDEQTLDTPAHCVPWLASQTDLLSKDWEVIEEV